MQKTLGARMDTVAARTAESIASMEHTTVSRLLKNSLCIYAMSRARQLENHDTPGSRLESKTYRELAQMIRR